MAFGHGKDSALLLDAQTFHGYIRGWEHTTEQEMADSTVIGNDGHKYTPGLVAGSLSLDGLLDTDAEDGGQDETLNTALRAAEGSLVTAAPAGLASGSRVISIEARQSNYALSSPVDDVVSFSSEWMAEGPVDVGVSLHALGAETETGTETGVDGEASSANGGIGVLHVTAASGTSPTLTVKVQHSADDETYADLATFTEASDVTSERKVVGAGTTVNQYLRASHTIGGTTPSFTYFLAFCRR